MEVEVTSVAKRPQALVDAAGAVFVITGEEIRRSGATSIPDALRMVPGMQVRRLNGSQWAVSSRGFSGRLANKLLVLIDGRSVYTPITSGVFWDQQTPLLADIDRIEVIRGPAATLWGANAVNGVINVITRHSAETRGGLVQVGGGDEERAFVGLRYGVDLSPASDARLYLNYQDRDDLITPFGDSANDAWENLQVGFRMDSLLGNGDRLRLQGDLQQADLRQPLLVPDPAAPPNFMVEVDDHFETSAWNLLGRWEHALSVSSGLSLQLYHDHTEREEHYLDQTIDTLDIEFELHGRFGRHELIGGVGYRQIDEQFAPNFLLDLEPERHGLWRVLLQDEIELDPAFHVTIGGKLEQTEHTGAEFQPNLRLLWQASEQATLWGAVSRAVRTPARIEAEESILRTAAVPSGPPPTPATVIRFTPDPDFESEKVTAYELGLRLSPSPRINLDLALFYQDYDQLRGLEPILATPQLTADGYFPFDLEISNRAHGVARGLELAADLKVNSRWRLALAYGYLDLDLGAIEGQLDEENRFLDRADPRNQLSLRSLWSPRDDLDLDFWLRYVDDTYPTLPIGPYQNEEIPAYWNLDLRLAWRPQRDLELSLVGQNLFAESHREGYYEPYSNIPAEVQRGVYGALRYGF